MLVLGHLGTAGSGPLPFTFSNKRERNSTTHLKCALLECINMYMRSRPHAPHLEHHVSESSEPPPRYRSGRTVGPVDLKELPQSTVVP
jgi:hypothetical protein